MSIEKRAGPMSRVFRSLIKKHMDMAKSIKDLKDLRVLCRRAGYRHSGPTDLKNKRRFFRSANDGEGQVFPPPYGNARRFFSDASF